MGARRGGPRGKGMGPLFTGRPQRAPGITETDYQSAALRALALQPWAVVIHLGANWSQNQKLAHMELKRAEFERKAKAGLTVLLWRVNSFGLRNAAGKPVMAQIPGVADISGMVSDGRRFELEMKTPDALSKRDPGVVLESAFTSYQKVFRGFCKVADVPYLVAVDAQHAVRVVQDLLRGG